MKNKIDCFLCGDSLSIRTTCKGKPYLVCDECGIQIFVRYETGIRRLTGLQNRQVRLSDRKYVVCCACDVAVRRTRKKIENRIMGPAGIFCPVCDELLLEAPEGMKATS